MEICTNTYREPVLMANVEIILFQIQTKSRRPTVTLTLSTARVVLPSVGRRESQYEVPGSQMKKPICHHSQMI